MADHLVREPAPGVRVHLVTTDRSDGDFAIWAEPSPLEARRAGVAPTPWTWLHQVHGSAVVVPASPGDQAGAEADAAVTGCAGATLAVQVADCAPVLMWSAVDGGAVVAAAHAGWRGLLAGVLPATVAAMTALGAADVHWLLGPCISAAAYEFGAEQLDEVAAVLGPGVRGRTAEGAPALDVRAAVVASLAAAGVATPPEGPPPACTATSGRHFSHRARGDRARQAAVIWWDRT